MANFPIYLSLPSKHLNVTSSHESVMTLCFAQGINLLFNQQASNKPVCINIHSSSLHFSLMCNVQFGSSFCDTLKQNMEAYRYEKIDFSGLCLCVCFQFLWKFRHQGIFLFYFAFIPSFQSCSLGSVSQQYTAGKYVPQCGWADKFFGSYCFVSCHSLRCYQQD